MRRILSMFKKAPLHGDSDSDGYGWRIEQEEGKVATKTGDAATLPMDTWTADPVEDKGMFNELEHTTLIPKFIPDGPEASFIALSYNDVDASCMAAKALRTTRSIEVVLAGLFEYVSRHPVAA